jgi:hypothetical protein
MSACTPAPPPESEPAMVMAMVSMKEQWRGRIIRVTAVAMLR